MFYINRWDEWTYNPLNDPVEVTRNKRRRLNAEKDEEQMNNHPDPAAVIEALFPTYTQLSRSQMQGPDFDDDCSECEVSAPNEGPDDNFAPVMLYYEDDEEDMEPCDCMACQFVREGNFALRHVTRINPQIFDGNFHDCMHGIERERVGQYDDDDDDGHEDDDSEMPEVWGDPFRSDAERESFGAQANEILAVLIAGDIWVRQYDSRIRAAADLEEAALIQEEAQGMLHAIMAREHLWERERTMHLPDELIYWACSLMREYAAERGFPESG